MKRIYTALMVLTLTMLCGCTQLGGHIGPIFGSWSLTGMSEDGLRIEQIDETVFSFQGSVVRIDDLEEAPYDIVTRFGSFTLSDKVLTLKFQEGPMSEGSSMYMVPDWLYFPKGATSLDFEVRKLTGSEMQLTLMTAGKTYTYSFKKTW